MNHYIVQLESLHKVELNTKDKIIEDLTRELNQLKKEKEKENFVNCTRKLSTENDIIEDLKKIVC